VHVHVTCEQKYLLARKAISNTSRQEMQRKRQENDKNDKNDKNDNTTQERRAFLGRQYAKAKGS
jgi:hypothetical protein